MPKPTEFEQGSIKFVVLERLNKNKNQKIAVQAIIEALGRIESNEDRKSLLEELVLAVHFECITYVQNAGSFHNLYDYKRKNVKVKMNDLLDINAAKYKKASNDDEDGNAEQATSNEREIDQRETEQANSQQSDDAVQSGPETVSVEEQSDGNETDQADDKGLNENQVKFIKTVKMVGDDEFSKLVMDCVRTDIPEFIAHAQGAIIKPTKKTDNTRLSLPNDQSILKVTGAIAVGSSTIVSTKSICNQLQVCHQIPNYVNEEEANLDGTKHIRRLYFLNEVKNAVDCAYNISCWATFCQNQGHLAFYKKNFSNEEAEKKVRIDIQNSFLQCYDLNTPDSQAKLASCLEELNATKSAKLDSVFDSEVKKKFIVGEKPYKDYIQAIGRGRKINILVKEFGQDILRANLQWSKWYKAGQKDLEFGIQFIIKQQSQRIKKKIARQLIDMSDPVTESAGQVRITELTTDTHNPAEDHMADATQSTNKGNLEAQVSGDRVNTSPQESVGAGDLIAEKENLNNDIGLKRKRPEESDQAGTARILTRQRTKK
ncbi:hypothetical protein MP228_002800 [Amoeboaphelidium protococcarum]|nr:hypothetical protein MP228_012528 [Amoeboaphelidium protococcarum]KAI3650148.1 hypothetical protein MP228_004997 [Amoeboaphelidium protococcarum]KAI3652475.1 hypothetical protein MP228_002800 [Amoeboaphelidium protococcarum]